MSERIFKLVYVCLKCNHEMDQRMEKCEKCNIKRTQTFSIIGLLVLILSIVLFSSDFMFYGIINVMLLKFIG